jgi:hypothetical protein
MPQSEAEAREFASRMNEAFAGLIAAARVSGSDQIYHNAFMLNGVIQFLAGTAHYWTVYEATKDAMRAITDFYISGQADSPHDPLRRGAIYQELPPAVYLDRKGGNRVSGPSSNVLNASDLPPDVDPTGYHGTTPYEGPDTWRAQQIAAGLPVRNPDGTMYQYDQEPEQPEVIFQSQPPVQTTALVPVVAGAPEGEYLIFGFPPFYVALAALAVGYLMFSSK